MAEYKDHFITENITEDISRLVRTKTGRIEAGPGFHDDSIMSYLIGMYVYYHGNNLAMFGFVRGSQEIKEQNKGIDIYDDLKYSDIIPQQDLDILKRQEETRKANDYDELMRKALIASQQESYQLTQRGLVNNNIIENTPDGLLDEMYDNSEIEMSFFDELNQY
jgi:hypothetical protein